MGCVKVLLCPWEAPCRWRSVCRGCSGRHSKTEAWTHPAQMECVGEFGPWMLPPLAHSLPRLQWEGFQD